MQPFPLLGKSMVTHRHPSVSAEQVILHPAELDGRAVELFLSCPRGGAAHPATLFVHGHQEPQRPGGRGYADVGRLDRMARAGFIAAAVSQPGYGGSDGPPDYCGPRTQLAISGVLGYLRSLDTVDGESVALYGVSRGATASAMVATREPQLRALILVAGIYDLGAAYPTGNVGFDANVVSERESRRRHSMLAPPCVT
jgi:dipeptidyl aminopeptidase/acylaminoacyl peptidase